MDWNRILIDVLIVGGVLLTALATASAWLIPKLVKGLDKYVEKKGENLATKEDIEEITRITKQVELKLNQQLEDHKLSNQLRVAALEKRLSVHQEAFSWWTKIIRYNSEGYEDLSKEAYRWWENNCLYLEPSVRDAFMACRNGAQLLHYMELKDPTAEANLQAKLMAFPDVLFKAMSLPILNPDTKDELSKAH